MRISRGVPDCLCARRPQCFWGTLAYAKAPHFGTLKSPFIVDGNLNVAFNQDKPSIPITSESRGLYECVEELLRAMSLLQVRKKLHAVVEG